MHAIIDLADVLERVDNDRELLGELCNMFLDEAPARLAAARNAIGSRDGQRLVQTAHALKGSAGNLGLTAVFEAAKRLEAVGRSGSWLGAEQDLELLAAELDRAAAALHDLLAPAPAERHVHL